MVVGVYLAAVLVTLLGLIGFVTIATENQKLFNTAFLIESAICVYALFKGADFFNAESTANLRHESKRLLATLWAHEQNAKGFWAAIAPTATNFRTYLRAVAQLHTLELISISLPYWSVSLTPEGIHYCKANTEKLTKITEHFFIEAQPTPPTLEAKELLPSPKQEPHQISE